MTNPLISIFMPTYNAERYVGEALDSALNQDYPNVEIIISDDASLDSTPEILKRYQKKYPLKIKLFLQRENLGVTKNCNFLLNKCAGEYICFFAGDDVLKFNCVSEGYKLSLQYYSEIIFHRQSLINDNGEVIAKLANLPSHRGTLKNFLNRGVYARANGMLINKKAIPASGYDESQPLASDFDFIIKVLNTKNSFYYTDQELSKYRRHALSITATDNLSCTLDNLKAYLNVMVIYPSHARYAKGAISRCYSGMRHSVLGDVDYLGWLINSISYDLFNFKAWIGIVVYLITLKRVSL